MSNDKSRPKAIVDDAASIAQRMREIQLEREAHAGRAARDPSEIMPTGDLPSDYDQFRLTIPKSSTGNCSFCNKFGWTFVRSRRLWAVCPACHNPNGMLPPTFTPTP